MVGTALVVLLAGCNLGTQPVNYPVTTSDLVDRELAAGDLNGDGAADLVVGAQQSYTVMLNDGAGGFTSTEHVTTALSLAAVELVDLDEDGALDMVAHDYGNTVVGGSPPVTSFFPGDGHGGFGAPVPMGDLRSAILGDLDADGHIDVVSATSASEAAVRLGDGSGGFGPATGYPIPTVDAFGFGDGVMADLTGDGHTDVVVAGVEIVCTTPSDCSFTPKVDLLTGDGTGALTAGPLVSAGTGDPVVGDFDEDGRLDVITAGPSAADLSLIRTDPSTGQLLPATTIALANGACAIETGDLDGDGHLDLVLATEGNKGIVLFGEGAGQFPAHRDLTTAGGPADTYCNEVIAADLDADSRPDVAYLSDLNDTLAVLLNRLGGPHH